MSESDQVVNRHVPPQGRMHKIGCSVPGCSGTRYVLAPGESLGRSAVFGRRVEHRQTECDTCGIVGAISVQVRVTQ